MKIPVIRRVSAGRTHAKRIKREGGGTRGLGRDSAPLWRFIVPVLLVGVVAFFAARRALFYSPSAIAADKKGVAATMQAALVTPSTLLPTFSPRPSVTPRPFFTPPPSVTHVLPTAAVVYVERIVTATFPPPTHTPLPSQTPFVQYVTVVAPGPTSIVFVDRLVTPFPPGVGYIRICVDVQGVKEVYVAGVGVAGSSCTVLPLASVGSTEIGVKVNR